MSMTTVEKLHFRLLAKSHTDGVREKLSLFSLQQQKKCFFRLSSGSASDLVRFGAYARAEGKSSLGWRKDEEKKVGINVS